ncbi:MAG: hypothetical protein ABSH22_21305 [Tepidisphaeraceae bacterium]
MISLAAFSGTVTMFADSTSGVVAGDYLATIYWGDGNQSSGVVSNSSGTYSVSGNEICIMPIRFARHECTNVTPSNKNRRTSGCRLGEWVVFRCNGALVAIRCLPKI